MTPAIPTPRLSDAAYALTKAGLSAVPLVGGPAVELFQYLVQAPLERRRQAWLADLGERLHALETRGLRLESLQESEQFLTTAIQATTAALKTHSIEKRNALRNAVLNVANGAGADETLQHFFLALVDNFSAMHLRVLAFARSPQYVADFPNATLEFALTDQIPDLMGEKDLYMQIWKELRDRALVTIDHYALQNAPIGVAGHRPHSRTSRLGYQFLQFISEPSEAS